MLDITKTTPCGRFTVTIVSAPLPANAVLTNQDIARSLKDLSDVLTEASTVALGLAVRLLESAGAPKGQQ